MKSILIIICLSLPQFLFAFDPAVEAPQGFAVANESQPLCGPLTQIYENKVVTLLESLRSGELSYSQLNQSIEALVTLKRDVEDSCAD